LLELSHRRREIRVTATPVGDELSARAPEAAGDLGRADKVGHVDLPGHGGRLRLAMTAKG
jgi:hypothetical protein